MNIQKKYLALVLIIVVIAIYIWWSGAAAALFSANMPTAECEGGQCGNQFTSQAEQTANVSDNVSVQDMSDNDPELDNIDEDAAFKPFRSENQYTTLSLSGDVTQFASSGVPLPNASLYNVNIRSYMAGLGDPIRGDVEVKPLNTSLIKSRFSSNDIRKGALSSIG